MVWVWYLGGSISIEGTGILNLEVNSSDGYLIRSDIKKVSINGDEYNEGGLTISSGTINGKSNGYGLRNDIKLNGGAINIISNKSPFNVTKGKITIQGGSITAQSNETWVNEEKYNLTCSPYYWRTSENEEYKCSTDTPYSFSSNHTYFAVRDTEPTKVIFNKNDGSNESYNQYDDQGNTITLKENTFTREGYTFASWNTNSDGSGSSYSDKATLTLSDNINLYAIWELIPAELPTVTVEDKEFTYGKGDYKIEVNATVPDGHTLAYEWYKCDKNGENAEILTGETSESYLVPSSYDAGEYYYYCKVTSTYTANGQTATTDSDIIKVTINQEELQENTNFTIEGDETVTYTGTPHSRKLNVPDGATVTYGEEAENYTLTKCPEYTKAGKYTVYYKIEGKNYKTFKGEFTIEIKKAPLTITPNNNTITYGEEPTNNGVTYNGFIAPEDPSVLSGEVKYTYDYNKYDDVGHYNIDISTSTLTADNYDITYEKGTLKVEPKEIGIEWGETTLTINGTPQAPKATATNTVNNDDITLTVDGKQTIVGKYTATVSDITGTKANNYKLPSDVSTEYIIQKDTPNIGTVGYSGTVLDTNTPNEVVLTRTNESVDGVLDLTDSQMLANKKIYNWVFTPTDTSYYNIITGTVEIDVIDTVAPSVSVKVENSLWKTFIKTITFSAFYNENQTVTINATDNENGSGIKEILYYLSNKELTKEELNIVNWEKYNGSFNINPNNKYIIYAKTIDNDGNVSEIVTSDGLVLYGESKAVTESIEYMYQQNKDKAATVELNDNTVKNIKNGEEILKPNTDYTVSEDGAITFKAEYLDTLSLGDYNLTISYNPMGEETDKVDITTKINIKVIKANATYTAPTANNLTYNGKEQKLIVAGTANGGKMLYSLTENGNYSEEIPTAIKPGEYKVYYYVEGDSNHNNSDKNFVTVTIEGEIEETTTTIPKTGDNILLYVTIFVISMLGFVAVTKMRKKVKNN